MFNPTVIVKNAHFPPAFQADFQIVAQKGIPSITTGCQ
jgi:hypothetical protein